MNVLALVVTSLSFAQSVGPARQQAEQALRLEFKRDHLAVPPAELETRFSQACERGYNEACRRTTWLKDGRPDPSKVLELFRPSCDGGDSVACLAVGWALDRIGREASTADEQDRLYRNAVRMLQGQCDRNYMPACHDYAGFVYYNKGLKVPRQAAVLIWDKACDAGEHASCAKLSRLITSGARGIKPKRKTAYNYAKFACDENYVDGCFLLAKLNQNKWDLQRRDRVFGDLCKKGHTESCFSLARGYDDGDFPEPSPGRAMELFEQACDLDHARSCFEAGRALEETDALRARSYFRRACDLDDAAACKALVDVMLRSGTRTEVGDNLDAFDVACEQRKSVDACAWLAYYLLDPDSARRDANRGRSLLLGVCTNESSDPKACFELGKCFENRVGGDRDRTEAVKYYRWACQRDITDACFRAGDLLEQGVGVTRDDAEALVMFGRACDQDMAEGCSRAGNVLTISTQITRSPAAAAKWYGKGCEMGAAESCLGLGETLERGVGSPNMEAAREAYQRGIDLGSAQAKTRLAYLMWNGFGGKKKKGLAKQLCRDACQAGDSHACRGPDFLTGA